MFKKKFIPLFVILNINFNYAVAQSTHYPLEINSCGHIITFKEAPKRVVTIGQSTTEILYALGLANKVQATSVWFNDVLPQYKDVNSHIQRLSDNDPGFESVVAKQPDLVTSQFVFHVGPLGSVGTQKQFSELGVNVYNMPSDCIGKNNMVAGDGSRETSFSIDTLYQGIQDLYTIFNVHDKGVALLNSLKERIATASKKAAELNLKDKTAVVWFSSTDVKLDPFVAGKKGIPAFILNTLGIHNIIKSDDEWPAVSWETILQANPDFIIIARMDRRRYPADDYQVKINFLRNDPLTRELKAVKNNHIIVVDAISIEASIRIADGIEAIVDSLKQFDSNKQ